MDPPEPAAGGWSRRNAGTYLTPSSVAPVSAYASDEWLMRREEVLLPQPRREPRRGAALAEPLGKTFTWTWTAPGSASPGKSRKRTYYTVENKYWSNNQCWRIETRAWDSLYPKGRILRVREGSGRLTRAVLTEGVGLGPTAGSWKFRQEVDGQKPPAETISMRTVTLTADPPRELDRGLIQQGTTYAKTLKAEGFVPAAWTWTLRLKDVRTGELLRTLTGEVTGNTQAERTFYTAWDVRKEDGTRVFPGTPVVSELEVALPRATVGSRAARTVQALAAAADQELVTAQEQACHFVESPCDCDCPPRRSSHSSPIPISSSNGVGYTYHSFVDLAIPTRGLPLVLARYHASQRDRDYNPVQDGLGGLAGGGGWRFSFHHKVVENPPTERSPIFVRMAPGMSSPWTAPTTACVACWECDDGM